MSRTIDEIYKEMALERSKRLELTEFNSDSKMSLMNGIMWVSAASIQIFESLMDVFAMDISTAINTRINGTPSFYAKALLQYQKGDDLIVREDGLAFGYSSIDTTKQIITQVSYEESTDDVNLDSKLLLKVATGEQGALQVIEQQDLVSINSYINKMKFAGTRVEVISQNGDILIPRITVYYDGAVETSKIFDNIDAAINEYVKNLDFNSNIYVSKVMDAIQSAEHVTDAYIDETAVPDQGIFLQSYNADGVLQAESKISRVAKPASGYVKQSSGLGLEINSQKYRNAISLTVDNNS